MNINEARMLTEREIEAADIESLREEIAYAEEAAREEAYMADAEAHVGMMWRLR